MDAASAPCPCAEVGADSSKALVGSTLTLAQKVDAACERLRDNNPASMVDPAVSLLLTVIRNIIKDPTNPKFRKIRKTNPRISSKMLTARGALGVLFAIGFRPEAAGSEILLMEAPSSLEVLIHAVERLNNVTAELERMANEERDKRLAAVRKEASAKKAKQDALRSSIAGDTAARKDPSWKAKGFEKTGCKIQRFEDIGVDVNAGG